MTQAYVVARRNDYPREPRMPYRERVRATAVGLPVLVIPIIVLGSILTGVATPTEAAVLGVISVILVGGLFYRELTVKSFAREMLNTIKTIGAVFLIISAAAVFGRVLTLYGAADALATWLTGITDEPLVFLLGVNVVYLLLGSMVDTVPILLVFVPILMPTVEALGIDVVHFGVITVFNPADRAHHPSLRPDHVPAVPDLRHLAPAVLAAHVAHLPDDGRGPAPGDVLSRPHHLAPQSGDGGPLDVMFEADPRIGAFPRGDGRAGPGRPMPRRPVQWGGGKR